ncbi:hypothetical protein IC617_08525 [Neiella sp. HB171785]|uniref:Uncharacterized protein n=1 Tax=Neiella litorisoli TaxID=2771431 RepID=A0A8J6R2T1_9GAMM|nr:hypothetical protein [Neiella litorisoli]MBD1389470.1 hypothetical protein [Neiella litorisoli]
MSNLKHGFDSLNPSINPDSVMLNRALLGSAELQQLVSLFDEQRLNVGHLHVAFNTNAPDPRPDGVEDLKGWLWWLCVQVEEQFCYESPQSKYANIAALIGSAINEFQLDTSLRIQDFIIDGSSKPFPLTDMQVHMHSLVSKLNALRAKF